MRGIGLLLALLAAPAPAAERKPEPLTRSELQTLTDEALARRIFGPLAADLFVGIRPDKDDRSWGAVAIWFYTRARKDWLHPGLCVADRIIVYLDDAPLRAFDSPGMGLRTIRVDTNYIIRDLKMAIRGSGFDPKELEGQDEACARLDPRRDSIPAESGWQLMKAREVLNQLGEMARAGKASVPIDCRHLRFAGPPPESEAECLKALSVLSERSVEGVQSCADSQVTGGLCLRVQTWDWFIYFVLRWADQSLERVIVHGVEDTSAIQ